MFGFLKSFFASDEDKAQALVQKRARAKQAASQDARSKAMAAVRENGARVLTPERQALIQKAMEVRKAKQKILENLDDESRAKLVALAITTLLHQDDPKPTGQKPAAGQANRANTSAKPAPTSRPRK